MMVSFGPVVERGLRVALVLATGIAACIACGGGEERPPPPEDFFLSKWDGEPHTGDLDEAYESICTTAIDCPLVSDSFDPAACVDEWSTLGRELPERCDGRLRELLACILADIDRCRTFCVEADQAVFDCATGGAACVGITSGVFFDDPIESLRIIQSFCACPSELAKGAPPGARCVRHTDCAATCCGCEAGAPGDERGFAVQACLDFECADAESACAEGRAFADETLVDRLGGESGSVCP